MAQLGSRAAAATRTLPRTVSVLGEPGQRREQCADQEEDAPARAHTLTVGGQHEQDEEDDDHEYAEDPELPGTRLMRWLD